MTTETLELTNAELYYLLTLITAHINSGMYWGDQEQFNEMEDGVLEKIEEAYNKANS